MERWNRKGKAILYWNDGDKYEVDIKNVIIEEKIIFYWNNGDCKIHKREEKRIFYSKSGDSNAANLKIIKNKEKEYNITKKKK